MLKRCVLYITILSGLCLKAQFNYGHQMDFGKNRIQYKDFVWTYLDYERYRVYCYQGGAEIAKYAALSVAKCQAILEKRLEYIVEDKLNILVYNNQGDFKQSNLGLSSDEQSNTGGTTRIIGDKISIFFNGSHAELDQQIMAALAELMINKILFGGNAREMIRNSTLLYIPEWYSKGLVKYLSEGWTAVNDNIMYDDLKNDNFTSFNHLTGRQAGQAGHALWYYIVSAYGENIIPTLLYMTKVQRSPENALIPTLGVSLDNLIYDFSEAFHRRIYMFRDSLRKSPINNNSVLKKYKPFRHYYELKISPDAKKVIYATNELNQLKVYMNTLETKKQKRLLKLGYRIEQMPDYNYPLLAWHPNGKIVSMIYQKEDALILHTLDLEANQSVKRNLAGFEKINNFSYSPDGKKMAMSAIKKGKGQSDIFVFTVNSSGVEQLTNDIWDDNNPVFIKGGKQVVFESNRVNDTIKASDDANYFAKIGRNADLFMAQYPFTSKVLVRIANTPDVNETNPQAYLDSYLSYISDKNGIKGRYLAEYDSAISFVDTTEHYRYYFKSKPVSNYDRNILEQNINPTGTHVAELIYANNNHMFLVSPLEKLTEVNIKDPLNTWYRGYVSPTINNPMDYKVVITENTSPPKDSPEKGIDFNNYKFEGEKDNDKEKKTNPLSKRDSLKKAANAAFKFPVLKNYYTSFYTDNIVTQFDNSYFNNNYQVFDYAGFGNPVYLNPGLNFLNKVTLCDLFEDQRIVGGVRLKSNFDSDNKFQKEFLLSWEQRKRRIDQQVILNRQTYTDVSIKGETGILNAKVNTSTIRYSFKYPFSPVSAVRVSFLLRNDAYVIQSVGDQSLRKRTFYENVIGGRAEYIFDNTRKVALNILNGFRMKVWTEYWLHQSNSGGDLFTSGLDARHYLKVHRQITWCNRFAGGNSLGSERLLFYLGGVDNWIAPKFNSTINVYKPEQYKYQTLATNLRGFHQNIRNGNNFLVYNSELRIPLFSYLLDHPLRSDFLNNFQIMGFYDMGLAWYGLNPTDDPNTENVNVFVQNNTNGIGSTGVIVTVIDKKSPLVAGMGFGFRSRLLGYFVRLDFGWGIENLKVLEQRVIGLSLSTDF